MEARGSKGGFWGLIERRRAANWVWNFVAILAGALVAGLIGLFTARPIRTIERRDEARGLASALRGEIQVICELLDVDADLENLDGAIGATEVLVRIQGARTIFDGSAGRLGHLPHPIPDNLVRFYGRVWPKVQRLERVVSSKSFFTKKNDGAWEQRDMRGEYEEARQRLGAEAGALRDDLQTFLDP